MKYSVLFVFPAMTALACGARADQSLVLENNVLKLIFANGRVAGLIEALDKRTGQTHKLDRCAEFALKLAPPEWRGESPQSLQVVTSKDMECRDAVAKDGYAVFTFFGNDLEVEVTYSLGPQDWFARKSFHITNRGKPVQIAAFSAVCIAGHEMHNAGESRRAAKTLVWGRPYYWLEQTGGAFCGTEYPSSRNVGWSGFSVSEYRPCAILEQGQPMKPPGGVIGFSAEPGEAGCRRAFESYLLAIHPPKLPYPVFFCPWGPWLRDVTNDQCLAAIRLCREAGIDMNMIDGRWPDYAKMDRILITGGTPDQYRQVYSSKRFPNGITEIADASRRAGLKFGLHFKISSLTQEESGVKESPYTLQSGDGETAEKRQCVASPYGRHMRDFVRAVSEQCDLDMIKLDFFNIGDCKAAYHWHYPGGYNAVDMQVDLMMKIIEDARRRKPDVYIYGACGNGWLSPWWAAWVDQLHTQDPGRAKEFKARRGLEAKFHALAFERRSVWWDRAIDNWCSPHVVKMDIGGFACQQETPVAYSPEFQDYVISEGVGWKETLLSTIGLSEVRDFRLNLLATSLEDRAFMKKWLDWARENAHYFLQTRPFTPEPDGVHAEGYANLVGDKGFLFLFNPADRPQEIAIPLDSSIGLNSTDGRFGLKMLYPQETMGNFAVLPVGGTLRLTLHPQGTVILAVARGSQVDPAAAELMKEYEADAHRIFRQYAPRQLCSIDQIRQIIAKGVTLVCPGDLPADTLIAGWTRRALEIIGGVEPKLASRPGEGNIIVIASARSSGLLESAGVNVINKWDDNLIEASDGTLVSGAVIEIRDNPLDPRGKMLVIAASACEQLWPAVETIRNACLPKNPKVIRTWENLSAHAELGEIEIPDSAFFILQLSPSLPPDIDDRGAAVRFKVTAKPGGEVLLDEPMVSMIGYDEFPNIAMERTKMISLSRFAGKRIRLILVAERWPERGRVPSLFTWGRVELISCDEALDRFTPSERSD